eukprot:3936967-Rhodomonas_salina.2
MASVPAGPGSLPRSTDSRPFLSLPWPPFSLAPPPGTLLPLSPAGPTPAEPAPSTAPPHPAARINGGFSDMCEGTCNVPGADSPVPIQASQADLQMRWCISRLEDRAEMLLGRMGNFSGEEALTCASTAARVRKRSKVSLKLSTLAAPA